MTDPQFQFYAQHPTTLVLKEKAWSFSGDDFSVKDQNGATVVKCSGKSISMRDTKKIKDPTGKTLFTMKNKLISIHKTFIGYAGDTDTEVFKITKKMSIGGAKVVATFKNHSTGNDVELLLKGDFLGGSAIITLASDGRPVAHITRQLFNVREAVHDKQTYGVIIAPGVVSRADPPSQAD